MILIKSASELTNHLSRLRNNRSISSLGFIPTMGALHQGHLSLIKQSVKENDFTVVSIFVNPTQFGEKADLEAYPRPIESDIALLMESGNNLLFLPTVEDIYPASYVHQTFDLKGLDLKIEGKQRPGHFQGVCNVIYRFFQLLDPDKAYFGQKDFQQTVVVKKLTSLMHIKTEIRVMPIAREETGLAMSSRNIRLSPEARKEAAFLRRFLLEAREEAHLTGLFPAIENMKHKITGIDHAELEYLIAVDAHTLDEVNHLDDEREVVLLTVVRFHGVRLLDNLYL